VCIASQWASNSFSSKPFEDGLIVSQVFLTTQRAFDFTQTKGPPFDRQFPTWFWRLTTVEWTVSRKPFDKGLADFECQ